MMPAHPQPASPSSSVLRFAIPKGPMLDNVVKLLLDAGVRVDISSRGYRPIITLPDCEAKLLKPQNIIEMLQAGSRDVGFAGADWVEELQATNVVQLLDTEMDTVQVVAAGPNQAVVDQWIRDGRHVVIASEYEELTSRWMHRKQITATFTRAYGAADSLPPEDADIVVDSKSPGLSHHGNNLTILDVVFTSTTRLYANADALSHPVKGVMINNLVLLLKSVLLARQKVMVTFNASCEATDTLLNMLPCMKAPTVSELHGGRGLAVNVCVDRRECPTLLPRLTLAGATGIIVTRVCQIVE